jgi:hypothetical protein
MAMTLDAYSHATPTLQGTPQPPLATSSRVVVSPSRTDRYRPPAIVVRLEPEGIVAQTAAAAIA